MNKTVKANVLACFLMIMQLVLVFITLSFKDEIVKIFPQFMDGIWLLAVNQLFSVFLPTAVFTLLICIGRSAGRVKATELLRIAPLSGKNLVLIVLMSIFVQPLVGVLSLLTQLVFTNNVGTLAADMAVDLPYLQMITCFAMLPAIFEELALRGAILGAYNELDERRAILINGLFFGLIHLDGQQFLYAIALGAFFAFIVIRTGSLFAGIIAHFTINASQVTLAFFLMRAMEPYLSAIEETTQEATALPEGMETILNISMLFSLAMLFIFIAASYAIFSRLLARFSAQNPPFSPQSHNSLNNDETISDFNEILVQSENTAVNSAEPPELAHLKNALTKRKNFTASFYISFFAVISIYLAFMFTSGCSAVQMLFLIGCLVSFFFVLFFLRVRS